MKELIKFLKILKGISDIIDINNSLLHMVQQNVDYVKVSSNYPSMQNNRIVALREFDVSYGIQMDIDCDVTFCVGTEETSSSRAGNWGVYSYFDILP